VNQGEKRRPAFLREKKEGDAARRKYGEGASLKKDVPTLLGNFRSFFKPGERKGGLEEEESRMPKKNF